MDVVTNTLHNKWTVGADNVRVHIDKWTCSGFVVYIKPLGNQSFYSMYKIANASASLREYQFSTFSLHRANCRVTDATAGHELPKLANYSN